MNRQVFEDENENNLDKKNLIENFNGIITSIGIFSFFMHQLSGSKPITSYGLSDKVIVTD